MPKQALIRFAEIAKGFDDYERLKLVLFASGVKPATYVILKVDPNNLTEKYRFEKRLKDLGVVFVESRMRSYEVIDRIVRNRIHWKIQGVWIGYDLFKSKEELKMFRSYVAAVRKQNHAKADKLGGKLYDYPACCVSEYIKEQNTGYLKKKFTYYQYYKRLHDSERKYPFVMHTPCNSSCKKTAKLNTKYRNAVKKFAPYFYKKFSSRKVYDTDLIVDAPSDIFVNENSVWPSKKALEYSVIAKKKYEGRNYIYTFLSRKFYDTGAVLDAMVTMQYRYADIKVKKVKKELKDLRHIRKFLVVGREF
ncbi:hypothetical protein GF343_04260 [Candidatus Woesearchaeota archaeon]|nr:hypothetical protein [Candidatus Woesearchaeota archaeon]